MKRDEAVYLRHILDAIDRIEEYLTGIDEAAYYQHHLVQDGVIRQLEIIGEAEKIYPMKYAPATLKFPGKISPVRAIS